MTRHLSGHAKVNAALAELHIQGIVRTWYRGLCCSYHSEDRAHTGFYQAGADDHGTDTVGEQGHDHKAVHLGNVRDREG